MVEHAGRFQEVRGHIQSRSGAGFSDEKSCFEPWVTLEDPFRNQPPPEPLSAGLQVVGGGWVYLSCRRTDSTRRYNSGTAAEGLREAARRAILPLSRTLRRRSETGRAYRGGTRL